MQMLLFVGIFLRYLFSQSASSITHVFCFYHWVVFCSLSQVRQSLRIPLLHCSFLLPVLSVSASCNLGMYCRYYIYNCYIFLVEWTFCHKSDPSPPPLTVFFWRSILCISSVATLAVLVTDHPFPDPFTFNPSVCLDLKCVSCRWHLSWIIFILFVSFCFWLAYLVPSYYLVTDNTGLCQSFLMSHLFFNFFCHTVIYHLMQLWNLPVILNCFPGLLPEQAGSWMRCTWALLSSLHP